MSRPGIAEEARRHHDELGQEQVVLTKDHITAAIGRIDVVGRQANETQVQLEQFKEEVAKSLKEVEGEALMTLYDKIKSEREASLNESKQLFERVAAVAHLVSSERAQEDGLAQGFAKQLAGVHDLLDQEREARKQDLARHSYELQTQLDQLKQGRDVQREPHRVISWNPEREVLHSDMPCLSERGPHPAVEQPASSEHAQQSEVSPGVVKQIAGIHDLLDREREARKQDLARQADETMRNLDQFNLINKRDFTRQANETQKLLDQFKKEFIKITQWFEVLSASGTEHDVVSIYPQDMVAERLAGIRDFVSQEREARKQELARQAMETQKYFDQFNLINKQDLARQSSELQKQLNQLKQEVENLGKGVRGRVFSALEPERDVSESPQLSDRDTVAPSGVSSVERAQQDVVLQGVAKQLAGVCDLLDQEREARNQGFVRQSGEMQKQLDQFKIEVMNLISNEDLGGQVAESQKQLEQFKQELGSLCKSVQGGVASTESESAAARGDLLEKVAAVAQLVDSERQKQERLAGDIEQQLAGVRELLSMERDARNHIVRDMADVQVTIAQEVKAQIDTEKSEREALRSHFTSMLQDQSFELGKMSDNWENQFQQHLCKTEQVCIGFEDALQELKARRLQFEERCEGLENDFVELSDKQVARINCLLESHEHLSEELKHLRHEGQQNRDKMQLVFAQMTELRTSLDETEEATHKLVLQERLGRDDQLRDVQAALRCESERQITELEEKLADRLDQSFERERSKSPLRSKAGSELMASMQNLAGSVSGPMGSQSVPMPASMMELKGVQGLESSPVPSVKVEVRQIQSIEPSPMPSPKTPVMASRVDLKDMQDVARNSLRLRSVGSVGNIRPVSPAASAAFPLGSQAVVRPRSPSSQRTVYQAHPLSGSTAASERLSATQAHGQNLSGSTTLPDRVIKKVVI